jgi:hypothetical protein
LEVLRPVADCIYEIHNGQDECELVGDMDWKTFELAFMQTCAWKPGMHGKQKHDVSNRQSLLARQVSVKQARFLRKRFSVLISSEENNSSGDMTFYGEFSHIRKTLDYTYHSNYTFERQKLQDAIISDMLDEAIILDVDGKVGTVPTEPWIVFTAGAMGCGKSFTMNKLVQSTPARFPRRAFIKVDPDEIRRLLPEYHMYINDNAELAGELTRKEVRSKCYYTHNTLARLVASQMAFKSSCTGIKGWVYCGDFDTGCASSWKECFARRLLA